MHAEEHESNLRSITKTITWRIIASATTVILVWMVTGTLVVGLAVGGIEAIAKMALYFLHERGWDRIDWGKNITEVD